MRAPSPLLPATPSDAPRRRRPSRPRASLTVRRAEPPPPLDVNEVGVRILICEDDPLIAMMMEALVEDIGHRCVGAAADKPRALALAAETSPDVALVDLDLADGPTGCAVIEALAGFGVASVIVSGRPDPLPRGAERAAARLSKPVNAALLARTLETVARPPATGEG